MSKYKLTGETRTIRTADNEMILHRIQAVSDFGNVKAGELGGWIESENNLSQADTAWVGDDARVCGNARVCDTARVGGNAEVYDNAMVYGNVVVCDNARVCDNAKVCGNAMVCGAAWVGNNARVGNTAEIFKTNHVLIIGVVGSRADFTTFYRGKNKCIMVTCGCFNGTLEQFLDEVNKTHGDNHYAKVYRVAAEVARLQIDLSDEVAK